jgi:lipopolysaccharide transport system permease protein
MFDMRANLAALSEAAATLTRHKELVAEMTRREVIDRFAGSALGGVWAIAAPALLLGANVFCFMYVMRLRFSPEDSGLKYAFYVLAGNTPWLALQDALGRATFAVVANAGLVKQIVFPSEILPAKVALGALPGLLVGVVIVVALGIVSGSITLLGFFVLLPVAIGYFLIMTAGLVYMLATLGVFLRDIREIITVVLSIGMFVHPIFYPPGSAPAWVETLFVFSPFSHLIWCFRDALFDGRILHPWSWFIAPIIALIFFAIGWRVFRMLRPSFGNVL